MKFDVEEVARMAGGRVVRAGRDPVTGVSTDTRTLRPGDLFVALKGPTFDGRAFLEDAFRQGASGGLVEEEVRRDEGALGGGALIFVRNTLEALGHLARAWRRKLDATVVAVTGSNGKTTTRRMIASIAGARLKISEAQKSFNNAVGVPLSLLGAPMDAEVVVLELGTSAPGEIAQLARIAEPDIGVVTNIGWSHVEGLGDIDGVAREKAALLEKLPAAGVAVLNWDNRWCRRIAEKTRARLVRVGRSADADLRARKVTLGGGRAHFEIEGHKLALPAAGPFQVRNALSAIAVARELGITFDEIAKRLPDVPHPPLRMERVDVAGVVLINDAYNANPSSTLAALRALVAHESAGRRVFVFGGMRELGKHSERLHARVGRLAVEMGVDRMMGVGTGAARAVESARDTAARRRGKFEAIAVSNVSEALEALSGKLCAGDVVLVKASRAERLERLIEPLIESLEKRTGCFTTSSTK